MAPSLDPSTPVDPRAQTRQKLAASIKQSAQKAIVDPEAERTSRMVILGHFLDPAADVVGMAISRFERGQRFPTLDREKIADYITRAMERKVLGMSASPMDLSDLLDASTPFAWSDRFASACVQSGITEVRRSRVRESGLDLHELDGALGFSPVGSVGMAERSLSSEDLYLLRERRGMVANLTEIVETWSERDMTRFEMAKERARAVRTLVGVPRASVIDDDHKRWLATFLTTDTAAEQLRLSLAAHRDLAGGDPQWEQLAVDDRLLDLWADYTSDQAAALLSAPVDAVTAIVADAAAFTPRPRPAKRVAIRRLAKILSDRKGWPSLVMRLERAWVAEHFSARYDTDAQDPRTDEEAEAERRADAADWPAAAEAALTFPGRPFGPSVRTAQDIAGWLARAYMVTQQQGRTAAGGGLAAA